MKMSKHAEKALRASIKHWEVDILQNGELPTRDNCKLCDIYHCSSTCPINKKTGQSYCGGTAYGNYRKIYNFYENTPEMKKQARRMIRFMKSLLPKKGEL